MIKFIRNLSFGWLLIIFSIVFFSGGMKMMANHAAGKTLICIDPDCKLLQAYGLFFLSIMQFILAISMLRKPSKRKPTYVNKNTNN